MKTTQSASSMALAVVLLSAAGLQAGLVDVKYSLVGGNTYQYTVCNNGLPDPVTDVVIYFREVSGPVEYQNLSVLTSPAGWTGDAIQPSAIALNGYVDWYTAGGIGMGDCLGGFAAGFDFSGTGIPGNQFFQVYDAAWNVVADGYTAPIIPEPASALACALATLLGVAGVRVQRARRGQK